MDKYYIPTIEEFYVGFEYEYLTVNNEWVKDAFMSTKPKDTEQMDFNTIKSILKDYPEELRVKYLDDDDIESLGFKFDVKTNNLKGICDYYCNGEIEISYNPYIHEIIVILHNSGLESLCLFIGKIKNKSELNDLIGKIIISIRG